jgi:NADH-quinone oxidoreductase subunit L
MQNYIFLTVLFPLAGFLINSLFGITNFLNWKSKEREAVVGGFATLAIFIPFLIVASIFVGMLGHEHHEAVIVKVYDWLNVGFLNVGVSYQIDTLSILMALIVTGVGSLIHLYSIGYMHGDPDFYRFFSYLNLFIFSMMNLILADNFALMFLGWEGVGLCSYLLIGFWYDRKFEGVAITSTNDAAKKAFITNRIGDFAMLGAMFLIFQTLGVLDFNTVIANAPKLMNPQTTFWVTLLIFIGCTGKSAQIPLYTWLPDAMAGPTPVSALIHAATMVTSGIYITARLSPLFLQSPDTMQIIAVTGACTALLAGTIGLVQNDIKKVLAYSTVSQLGFMFLALGVGAFKTAIFHVMTHAFFKACLFLGSGSVIHAMHEEQDIRRMGGLRKYMPATSTTFFIASLALAGFPLSAGFFSKDDILGKAFASEHYVLWGIGIFTAFLTAFYTMRLYVLTFLGDERYAHKATAHGSHGHDAHGEHDEHAHGGVPHESSALMTIPLWILAALSLVGGFLGLPAVVQEHNLIDSWLESSVAEGAGLDASHATEWGLIVLSSVIAIAGLYISYIVYTKRLEIAEAAKKNLKLIYNTLLRKYYADEFYEAVVVKPVQAVSEQGLWPFDKTVIDGFVNLLGKTFMGLGGLFRKVQTGVAQNYAVGITVGLVLILTYIVLR